MPCNDVPVIKREQLGKGVRGKYFQQYTQQSNVVVLKPEIRKAFPTSEAVNKALASMLAFSQETQSIVGRPSRCPSKCNAARRASRDSSSD
jgi:hypothetical protein